MRYDAIVVGGSLSGAAAAKRLVDAGLHTLVIERKRLPREKPCTGIVSPRGHRFLIENFGPIPPEALHEPRAFRGVTFHFPRGPMLPMDFDHGPTPQLYRKHSDHWALLRSGAEVMDHTRAVSVSESRDGIILNARREREDITLRARYLIGADGPNSSIVRAVYPGFRRSIPWFMVKQYMHEIEECGLDAGYFHFWFDPALGFYTWTHPRNGRQLLGVGYEAGDDLDKRHEGFVERLRARHGVRLGPGGEPEGSVNNFGLSLINRYVFGRGRVLITGQASGFLNMIAEGMSCALHSGAIAGEAVADALAGGREAQPLYRAMIASEVRRCSDQWNPWMILFGRPHEADFRAAMRLHTAGERWLIWTDLMRFLYPWGRYNWGRQMAGQAIYRKIRDGYDPSRWM